MLCVPVMVFGAALVPAGCGKSDPNAPSVFSTIKGRVTHTPGDEPIAGVSITRQPQTFSYEDNVATTDTNGDYTMKDVRNGTYTLSAVILGYGPLTKNAKVERNVTVNFALKKIYYDGAPKH